MTAKVACCPEGGLPRPSTAQMGGARSNHDSRRSHMQYRTLGRTGIKVSPYALGALMLGASIGNPDIEETLSALSDLIHSGKVRAIGSSMTPASDIIEAQWVAERRGLERFRTEQPCYSILNRSIESEVLPIAQRYGMGVLVWGPLGQGMLTGRARKGQQTDLVRETLRMKAISDEHRLDAVEQLIPLAEEAGMPMTHLSMAFAISHPGVTSALLGAHTMEQLDDLLAGLDVTLTDDLLDRIDEIVPPGTDVGTLDQAYVPPALQRSDLRRRPVDERAGA